LSRASEAEACGYILKPFRASDLRAGVEIALSKHRLEAELRERERWFSTTLRAIGDGVITVDSEQKVTFVNRAAEALTKSTREELVGRRLEQVFQLSDERTGQRVPVLVRDPLLESPARAHPDRVLMTATGNVPIEESMAPIVDEQGQHWGSVIVFHDVSERRRLEQQVAHADRLASLGTLAAGVAHEINNPLTFVLGNVSVVLEELQTLKQGLQPLLSSSDAAQRSHATTRAALAQLEQMEGSLREANEGAERIRHIVNDLRLFAHSEPAKASSDVAASIGWAVRVAGPLVRQRARLELELSPLPPARGDGVRLGQVFLNLLINAAQAITEGRPASNTIRVTAGVDAERRIAVSITDSGAGMPPEIVKRIFDPFFTTKPVGAGTGLGLSICHGIVQSLGGELRVESTLGLGSTFHVLLPLGETLAPSAPASSTTRAGLRGRILIVDDDDLVRRTLHRMLARSHDVTLAESARAALAVLTADASFDLVLCDVMMPEISGIELFEHIGARWPQLESRIGFLTGASFTPHVAEFLDSVPNPRVTKPLNAGALNEFVQDFLARARAHVA
jgi:PAS domain S-box-containing protein